jgi:hypothetical protein
MCTTDESLRDDCGKCPGQTGFGKCNIVKCSVAFTDCVINKDINIEEAIENIEQRVQVLEQAAPPSPPLQTK